MNKTVTLPNGSTHERLYKCADCKYVSNTHNSRQRGHGTIATCEQCGEASLQLKPGEKVEN